MATADDIGHMRAALALARRNLGAVWPNPSVGCVLVRDGTVVGRGWTRVSGRPHAETEALLRAGGENLLFAPFDIQFQKIHLSAERRYERAHGNRFDGLRLASTGGSDLAQPLLALRVEMHPAGIGPYRRS